MDAERPGRVGRPTRPAVLSSSVGYPGSSAARLNTPAMVSKASRRRFVALVLLVRSGSASPLPAVCPCSRQRCRQQALLGPSWRPMADASGHEACSS